MTSHSIDSFKIPVSFWKDIRQLNISPQDVVRNARMPLTILTETTVVTTAQFFALWQALSDLLGNPAETITKLFTNLETSQLPPNVLAAYHARDYRDALHRLARYKQMCAPERFHITEKEAFCTIELEWLYKEQPEPLLLDGAIIASLMEIGRRGTGLHLTAKLVELVPPIGEVRALEDYFGCEVRLGAGRTCLTLDRNDLDRPFRSYNAELLEILTPALDKMLDERQRNYSITQTVKWMIKRNLPSGRPDIQVIASELGISDRTLQRRLTDEGASFKQLLSDSRHEQAQEYLSDPSLDIKEVAFLLGYEDQNSFYRAFRNWEGDTPSNWRAIQLGAPSIDVDRETPSFH